VVALKTTFLARAVFLFHIFDHVHTQFSVKMIHSCFMISADKTLYHIINERKLKV
jgi:hypothetical protein